jgi:hypothetical protein
MYHLVCSKSSIFWDITLCGLLKVNRCFQGTYSALLVSYLTYSLTLKMEATCSSEISADFQWTTWHYIPEDRTFHNHHCENPKSYAVCISSYSGHMVKLQWAVSQNSIWPEKEFYMYVSLPILVAVSNSFDCGRDPFSKSSLLDSYILSVDTWLCVNENVQGDFLWVKNSLTKLTGGWHSKWIEYGGPMEWPTRSHPTSGAFLKDKAYSPLLLTLIE